MDPPQAGSDDFTAIDNEGLVMLAPYWSDNDFRVEGGVSYAVYSSTQNSSFTAILNATAQAISNERQSAFNADWMLLVEWNNVSPFPAGSGSSPTPPYTTVYTALVSLHTTVLCMHSMATI